MTAPITGGALAIKTVWQVLAAMVVAVLPLVSGDGPNTPSEWINAVLVALGAGTVYIAKNLPDETVWQYTKTIMSAIAAGGVVANSALTDGITATEWFQIGAAIVGVLLVYFIPNDTALPTGRHRAPEVPEAPET